MYTIALILVAEMVAQSADFRPDITEHRHATWSVAEQMPPTSQRFHLHFITESVDRDRPTRLPAAAIDYARAPHRMPTPSGSSSTASRPEKVHAKSGWASMLVSFLIACFIATNRFGRDPM